MPAVEAAAKLLTAAQVAGRFGVSRLTIGRWIDRGDFPKPIQPAGRKGRRYWPADVIDAYSRGRLTT